MHYHNSYTCIRKQLYLTRVKSWLVVGKELGGELKKGKERNGKTALNPSSDVRRSEAGIS